MSYSVTKETQGESTGLRFIDPGIVENIEMVNIRYEQTEKSEFIAFEFLNESGQTFSHTEYKPTNDDPKVLEQKQNNQVKRIKHIAKRFIDESDFIFEAKNFEEFAKETIRRIGDKYKGVKLRAKIVLNWNNYTTFPNYLPFLENMTLPKADSLLEITSLDKMKRETADRETNSQRNPFEETKVGNNSTEDDNLPF